LLLVVEQWLEAEVHKLQGIKGVIHGDNNKKKTFKAVVRALQILK